VSEAGLLIANGLVIPQADLSFTMARSSGPGGQHVNKTETKVTLSFDLAGTSALNEEQKAVLRESLATRINKAGELRVSSQRHRSQKSNREAAIERFTDLVRQALEPRRERKATRVPKKAQKKRLEEKRRTAEKKKGRQEPSW
jgi:ribosome-associated protein